MGEVMTVSAREAAERLGIGLATLYKLLRQRKIPAVWVGRRPNFRISLKALDKVLAEPERLSLESEGEEK